MAAKVMTVATLLPFRTQNSTPADGTGMVIVHVLVQTKIPRGAENETLVPVVSGVTAPDYAGQIKRGATNMDIGPRQIEAPANPMGSSARGPVVPDIVGASSRGKGGGQYLLPAPEHGTPPVNVLPRGPAGAG